MLHRRDLLQGLVLGLTVSGFSRAAARAAPPPRIAHVRLAATEQDSRLLHLLTTGHGTPASSIPRHRVHAHRSAEAALHRLMTGSADLALVPLDTATALDPAFSYFTGLTQPFELSPDQQAAWRRSPPTASRLDDLAASVGLHVSIVADLCGTVGPSPRLVSILDGLMSPHASTAHRRRLPGLSGAAPIVPGPLVLFARSAVPPHPHTPALTAWLRRVYALASASSTNRSGQHQRPSEHKGEAPTLADDRERSILTLALMAEISSRSPLHRHIAHHHARFRNATAQAILNNVPKPLARA